MTSRRSKAWARSCASRATRAGWGSSSASSRATRATCSTSSSRVADAWPRGHPRSADALGEVGHRFGVAIFDGCVGRVEELEEMVVDAEREERAVEGFGAEVEVVLVALSGIDVDCTHRLQRAC